MATVRFCLFIRTTEIIRGEYKQLSSFFQDKDIKINVKKAQNFFSKACNKRSAKGCYYLAFTHLRGGKGVEKSDKKAMYDFARGCHLGNMSSCDQYDKLEEG